MPSARVSHRSAGWRSGAGTVLARPGKSARQATTRLKQAAAYYRQLSEEFGKVVVRDGKTGLDLYNELTNDKRVRAGPSRRRRPVVAQRAELKYRQTTPVRRQPVIQRLHVPTHGRTCRRSCETVLALILDNADVNNPRCCWSTPPPARKRGASTWDTRPKYQHYHSYLQAPGGSQRRLSSRERGIPLLPGSSAIWRWCGSVSVVYGIDRRRGRDRSGSITCSTTSSSIHRPPSRRTSHLRQRPHAQRRYPLVRHFQRQRATRRQDARRPRRRGRGVLCVP